MSLFSPARLPFSMGRLALTGFLALVLGVSSMLPVYAHIRYSVYSPATKPGMDDPVALTTIDQKREANALVLYTPSYGDSTRTNAVGAEIIAKRLPVSHLYQVIGINSTTACAAQPGVNTGCGDAKIPSDGLVLSGTGAKATWLLNNYKVGDQFTVDPTYTYDSRATLTVVNPSPVNNPTASAFPGYRGGGQLVIYDAGYGQPTTGTNEFGFEVTVINDRVVDTQGANSVIPSQPGAFILSGHGKSRQWLINNAPVGARISVEGDTVISQVDREAYQYLLDSVVAKIKSVNSVAITPALQKDITYASARSVGMSDDDACLAIHTLTDKLTKVLWSAYPTLKTAKNDARPFVKAVWQRPEEASRAQVQATLDNLRNAGFDTVFLETYLHGDPIFPSKTFKEWGIAVNTPFKLKDAPTQDVLAYWVEQAHLRGMKVHVWFQTFYAGNKATGKPSAILTAYPDWANVQRMNADQTAPMPSNLETGSYFLDPAHPKVRQFLSQLIDEIVTNYPIDGFQLDYIRYPSSLPAKGLGTGYVNSTWGYSAYSRNAFMQTTQVDPTTIDPKTSPELWKAWNTYKINAVSSFVSETRKRLKLTRPQLPLSVAIFPDPEVSVGRKHQDWLSWAQQSWVDFIAPMTLTSALENIASDTKRVNQASNATIPVVTGLFGPFNGNSPTDLTEQVWTAYQSGASGVAIFDTAHLTQLMQEALGQGLFKTVIPAKAQALPKRSSSIYQIPTKPQDNSSVTIPSRRRWR